ncbi:MAG TPA: efflux RND transporter periplasmic adaptor subunit [Bryobacteraceae bacterium]|nr:efflux RND transporter periplasmic adaptor subunit [Bryobacteraceae bacterium]
MMTPAKSALAVCVAVGLFAAGYMANRQPGPAASSASNSRVLYYTCPMHPQYKSDRPGDAPCCGMRLEPVYAGSTPAKVRPVAGDVPGMVLVDAGSQQLIGVRTDEVKRESVSHLLRVPGRIAVDENRLYRIVAAGDGWIRTLGANPAGTLVKKDQILASYYAPNLQSAQQTLLFALENGKQLLGQRDLRLTSQSQRPNASTSVQIAMDAVRTLGMSDVQIEEIRQTRAYASEIHIYSPTAGFVIARNISPEQRFDKGSELYRIADLSHVWIVADLFEKDQEYAKPGSVATVRYQARELRARMSDVLPQFDPQSRTLKTRFEIDNPGYVLRPDMFVDVELRVERPAAITVPTDALIDSGQQKTVFVECGAGCFAPRPVETGLRVGDRVEITSGIEPGERIVISGTFLIDSESRMRLAAVSTPAAAGKIVTAEAAGKPVEIDPVCGMEVEKESGAITTVYRGKTYWFCSKSCKADFEENPAKYLSGSVATSGTGLRGPA